MASVPQDRSGRQVLAAPALEPAKVILHPSVPQPAVPDPIPGLMPGGTITLLSGASQVGKTALVSEWIARWQGGRSICQHAVAALPALGFIAADRRWESHEYWLHAAGVENLAHYSLRDDPAFNWNDVAQRPKLPAVFMTCVQKLGLPRGSLVIVDPLAVFIHGTLMDYKQTIISLALLDRKVQELGISVLGIMHMSKQKGDKKERYSRPQDRILGSAALGGFTDTQMYLISPDDTGEEYYEVGWIPHNAPQGKFELTRHHETGLFIPYEFPGRTEDMTAILGLVTTASTGVRASEIIGCATDQFGISRASTYRCLNELAGTGKIKRIGRGIWRRLE